MYPWDLPIFELHQNQFEVKSVVTRVYTISVCFGVYNVTGSQQKAWPVVRKKLPAYRILQEQAIQIHPVLN